LLVYQLLWLLSSWLFFVCKCTISSIISYLPISTQYFQNPAVAFWNRTFFFFFNRNKHKTDWNIPIFASFLISEPILLIFSQLEIQVSFFKTFIWLRDHFNWLIDDYDKLTNHTQVCKTNIPKKSNHSIIHSHQKLVKGRLDPVTLTRTSFWSLCIIHKSLAGCAG
jgi:hypothetical protein